MAETRLVRTTALAGLRPLGRLGQPAIDAHRQLTAVLRGRLGPDHAALFARPERRADGGIDWFTDLPGEIRPLDELTAAERSAVETELSRMLTDVTALADAVQASGSDSARHLASLLRDAARVAGPHARLAAGGRPVLILWGFAPEQELPGPPTPIAAIAPAPAPATALASLAVAPAGLRNWWRWLLLALLLLIALLLLMRACAPLPPRSAEAGADPDALGAAEARAAELEQELAALRRQREETAACPVPPEIGAGEPPPPVVAEGNAPVTPEPDSPPSPEPAPAPARPEPPDLPDLPQIAEAPSPAPAPPPEPAEPEESCVPPRHPSEAPEVALVVDSSGSMEEPIAGAANRLEAAKRAIGDLLDGLPEDVAVGLVEFDDCERIRRDRFYSGSERGQLKAQVDALRPGRGTPLARSVERAGSILSSQVPGVIIVVTDGQDSCEGDPCAAARAIKQKRPNVVVNVVDIGSGGSSPAACMAEITGGKVYRPGSAIEFDRMIAEAGGQPDIRECR